MVMKRWLYIPIVLILLNIAVISSYVYFKDRLKSNEAPTEELNALHDDEEPILVEETEPEKTEEEKQRETEIEAERRRKAELEAEQRRRAQLESERRRQKLLEAEKKRQAKIKAEKIRLQHWNAMLDESYAVDMYNDYSALASDESSEQIGRVIDTQIKQRLEGFYPELFTIEIHGKIPLDKPIDKLTAQDMTTLKGTFEITSDLISKHNNTTAFIGEVSKAESGLKILLRAYSKTGNFLSSVVSAEAQIQNEIAVKYSRLAVDSFPFSGKVTQKSGANVKIALKGGYHLGKLPIQKRNYFWFAETGEIFKLSSVRYPSDINRLIGVLPSKGQSVQVDATVVSTMPRRTVEKRGTDKITTLLLVLHDDSDSPLQNCKIYASTTGYSDATSDFVQRTNLRGEIKLNVRGEQAMYVTVKRHDDVIARFETSAEKEPVDRRRLKID